MVPATEPKLVLDCGDAFAKGTDSTTPADALQQRAELIVDVFNQLGTKAYTIGERDLSLGVESLLKLSKKAKFPFLAANLVGEDDKPVFGTSVIEKLGELRIGIMGLVGTKNVVQASQLEAAKLRLVDPVTVATAEAARLRAEGVDLLVVLSHLGNGEEAAIATAVPDIRFFVGGHDGRMLNAPQAVGNAWKLESGSRGKYVGRLEIYPAPGSKDFSKLAFGDQARAIGETLEQRNRSLAQTQERLKKLGEKPVPEDQAARHATRVEGMQRSIERLSQQIEDDKAKLAALPSVGNEPLFGNRLDPISVTIAEQPAIASAVKAIEPVVDVVPRQPPKRDLSPRNPTSP